MVQGRNVTAEIEAPQIVEIPRKRRNVDVLVRISLLNNGEDDFIAHAEGADDTHFWHVLDEDEREVMRQKKDKGKAGVRVFRGVHSYRTETVAGGHGLHDHHTLTLDGRKLEEGHVYTIRGEIWGHRAETTFVAVNEAQPRKKGGKKTKTAAGKKKAAPKKKAGAKKTAAKKKAAPKRKSAARKRPARKTKSARGRKK